MPRGVIDTLPLPLSSQISLMRLIPLAAILALAVAAPAAAQQSATPAPAPSQAQKAQADKQKAEKEKAEKAEKAKAAKAKENERYNKGGAARGEERAGQVKEMNNQRKAN